MHAGSHFCGRPLPNSHSCFLSPFFYFLLLGSYRLSSPSLISAPFFLIDSFPFLPFLTLSDFIARRYFKSVLSPHLRTGCV